MVKKTSFSSGSYFDVIGRIILWLFIFSVPFMLGWHIRSMNIDYTKRVKTERIGFEIPIEPCEYKDNNIYFKGSCDDVHSLVGIDIRQDVFNRKIADMTHEFEFNCKEFIAANLFNNLRRTSEYAEELEGMTLEEFKEDDDLGIILNMSCQMQ